jgi:hypothetical protein
MKVRTAAHSPVKVPASQKSLIVALARCPEQQLSTILQKIKVWPFEKGDLSHWAEVLNRFDSILENIVEQNKSNEEFGFPCIILSPSLPKELIVLVLRFITLLSSNCVASRSKISTEQLSKLLCCEDSDIVCATLETLAIANKAVPRTAHAASNSLVARLLALTRGWGGRQEGLDLAYCCEFHTKEQMPKSISFLHFEFYRERQASNANEAVVIHVQNLDSVAETPLEVLKTLVAKYSIPKDIHFNLFIQILLVKKFHFVDLRQQWVFQRLLAIKALANVGGFKSLAVFLHDEPEFVSDVVELLRTERLEVVPQNVRLAALSALIALVADRAQVEGKLCCQLF